MYVNYLTLTGISISIKSMKMKITVCIKYLFLSSTYTANTPRFQIQGPTNFQWVLAHLFFIPSQIQLGDKFHTSISRANNVSPVHVVVHSIVAVIFTMPSINPQHLWCSRHSTVCPHHLVSHRSLADSGTHDIAIAVPFPLCTPRSQTNWTTTPPTRLF